MLKSKITILAFMLVCLGMLSLTAQENTRRERKNPAELPIPGATHLLPAQPGSILTLPFFDDFESGAPGWTSDGQFNLIANPQNFAVLNPEINPTLVILPDPGNLPSAFSGNHAWWFGETATGTFIGPGWNTITQTPLNGGTSLDTQTGSLISPVIDLNGVSQAQLRFRTWWEIEGVDVDAYDLMHVEISTDNGATFNPIDRGLLNPLNDVDGESWKSYSSGGLGQPGVWLDQLFDLSPFVGNMVYLRFRFDTGDALYNGFRGWFIDDVSVTSDPFPAPSITSIVPNVAYPGEFVAINGQNFSNGASIEIGGFPPLSAVIASNQAIVEVPFLTAGQYDVKLTNPDGQFALVPNGITITNTLPPSAFSIDPDSAMVGVSEAVTISGQDFQAGATVEIGGVACTNVNVVNDFTITANSPSSLPVGTYNVRVTNPDGQFDQLILAFRVYTTTGIEPLDLSVPDRYELSQNFPNSFNPTTNIRFAIPHSGQVKLTVYNVAGQEVATLVNAVLSAGAYNVDFDARHLSSGVYFYRIEAGSFMQVKKMLLTR